MNSKHRVSLFIFFCLSFTAPTRTMDQVLALLSYPKTLAAVAVLVTAYRINEKIKSWENYPQLNAAQALQRAVSIKPLQELVMSYVDDPREQWVINIQKTIPSIGFNGSRMTIFDHPEVVAHQNPDYNLLRVTHNNYLSGATVMTARIKKQITAIEDFEVDALSEVTLQDSIDERVMYKIKIGPSKQSKKLKQALRI